MLDNVAVQYEVNNNVITNVSLGLMNFYHIDKQINIKVFCTCGLSSKNPYCDGSHKGTGFSPEIVILEEDKKVAWCGCKHSSKGAFCDGSHRNL